MRYWICLLITLVLVPGSLSTGDKQSPELAMVPADSVFFAHVRLQDVYKSEQFKLFRDIIGKAGAKALAAYDRRFFPTPSSLDRATVFVPAGGKLDKLVMIITTSQAIDKDAFVKYSLPGAEKEDLGKLGPLFVVPDKGVADKGMEFWFANSNTLVFGPRGAVREHLRTQPAKVGGMSEVIKLARAGKAVVAGFNFAAIPDSSIAELFKEENKIPPPVQAVLKTVLKAKTATVVLDLGRDEEFQVRLTYPSATLAGDAVGAVTDALRTSIGEGREEMMKWIEGAPGSLKEQTVATGALLALGVLNYADEFVANGLIRQEGNSLVASVKLSHLRLFARASSQPGNPPPPGGRPRPGELSPITFLDGNPQFTGNEVVGPNPSAQLLNTLATSTQTRRGVAADGVSKLVLRAKFSQRGRVTFILPGTGDDGKLTKLDGTEATRINVPGQRFPKQELTVETQEVSPPGDRPGQYAFALYTPPKTFDYSTIERFTSFGTGRIRARELIVPYRFAPSNGAVPALEPMATENVQLQIVPAPVVLVHGTYDSPYSCWDTPAFLPKTMVERLKDVGCQVWLVDYRYTSGKVRRDVTLNKNSTFATNKKVVWDHNPRYYPQGPQKSRDREVEGNALNDQMEGHVPLHCEPGGIKTAVEEFRRQGLAATQADCVGHSMGGVLIRVYASDGPNGFNPGGYKRPENFNMGDIHRIITLCSTHKGSDIPRVLRRYTQFSGQPNFWDRNRTFLDNIRTDVALISSLAIQWQVDVTSGMNSGAFHDQTPGSEELQTIGPTPIPSHAIVCVSLPSDYWFDGNIPPEIRTRLGPVKAQNLLDAQKTYFDRFRLVLGGSTVAGPELLEYAFRQEDQEQDARRVLAFTPSQIDIRTGRPPLHADPFHGYSEANRLRDENKWRMQLLLFRSAIFGNCRNDCTVREESAKGGLTGRYVSTIMGVLHGYAPCYKEVQDRVVELIKGGMDDFDRHGFPDTVVRRPGMPETGDIPTNTRPGTVAPKVPDFSGKTVEEATRMAYGLMMTPELVRGRVDEQKDNIVYAQGIPAGTVWSDQMYTITLTYSYSQERLLRHLTEPLPARE